MLLEELPARWSAYTCTSRRHHAPRCWWRSCRQRRCRLASWERPSAERRRRRGTSGTWCCRGNPRPGTSASLDCLPVTSCSTVEPWCTRYLHVTATLSAVRSRPTRRKISSHYLTMWGQVIIHKRKRRGAGASNIGKSIFQANLMYNAGILFLLIFLAYIFRKNVLPPKLTELLRLLHYLITWGQWAPVIAVE